MTRRIRSVTVLLATSFVTVVAGAQTPATPSPPAMRDLPRASNSQAAAQTAPYRSVFDSYVSANEDKAVSWRDANALVKEIGGWRVYARESQLPTPANTLAPAGRSPAPHQKH